MPHENPAKRCARRKSVAEIDMGGYPYRDICADLPAIFEHEGETFCVLHAPSRSKTKEFNKEVQRKLSNEDYNFYRCYFPSDFAFINSHFKTSFNFMEATFNGETVFMGQFDDELDFRFSTFEKESKLVFRYCELRGGLDLRNTTIRGHVRFEGGESKGLIDTLRTVFDGEKAYLDLQNAIIETPEQVLFHTVRLRPSWFVEVDCRKFVFTDCRWLTHDGKVVDTIEEIDSVYMKNGVLFPTNPNALLTKTCLQLADNYESNKDYEASSLFWKMANDAKRYSEYWGFKIWSLRWWYWLLSLYGESWRRAALWLVFLIVLFSVGYKSQLSRFADATKEVAASAQHYVFLDYRDALIYSLRTGTLQKPDPPPSSKFAKTLVAMESIFVPLQAALLALAIRRRFMR